MPNAKVLSEKQAIVAALTEKLQQSVDQIRQEKGCSVDELFREVFRYAE